MVQNVANLVIFRTQMYNKSMLSIFLIAGENQVTIEEWTLFIIRLRLLFYFVFRTRSICFRNISFANGAGGVSIFELLVFHCFV